MRTLVLEPHMGASGDMLLGALLAAGADRSVLEPVEAGLDVEYRVQRVEKAGIVGTGVDVVYPDATAGEEGDAEACDRHHESHEHAHGDHDHVHAEGHGPARTLAEVREMVEDLEVPERVREDARAVFEHLAAAEGAVHGEETAGPTFHAVGADDAIADIVGTALLLDDLDVDRVVSTPVSTGGGTVTTSHGEYPVPVPAVVELAESADWDLRGGPVEAELLTPTGAALLAQFAEGVDWVPRLDVDSTGYGAGGYDFPDRPNVLRATVGRLAPWEAADEGRVRPLDATPGLRGEDVLVLEAAVDDASPEVLGGLQETLEAAGARDVSVVPLTMKKSRPGHLVKVVARPADADAVAAKLAAETGTLGVRETGARHRWVADRASHEATVSIDGETYPVTVKVASNPDGEVYDVSAEYDDARTVALETGLPIREVMRRAEAAYREG